MRHRSFESARSSYSASSPPFPSLCSNCPIQLNFTEKLINKKRAKLRREKLLEGKNSQNSWVLKLQCYCHSESRQLLLYSSYNTNLP